MKRATTTRAYKHVQYVKILRTAAPIIILVHSDLTIVKLAINPPQQYAIPESYMAISTLTEVEMEKRQKRILLITCVPGKTQYSLSFMIQCIIRKGLGISGIPYRRTMCR